MKNKLKYAIIKTRQQYNEYCQQLETLASTGMDSKQDEIELLTFLIEKWDKEHSTFTEKDPVETLKYLMEENGLKAMNLMAILGVSKGMVSAILNYRKGLSKENIRKLAAYFKISQENFNKHYSLDSVLSK
ncbi:MAG: transcriptional regulator [Bacteroidia bacterium]